MYRFSLNYFLNHKDENIDIKNVCISLAERKRLQQEIEEKKQNLTSTLLPILDLEEDNEISDEEILSRATVIISLKEWEELQQKTKETKPRDNNTLVPILDVEDKNREIEPTQEAIDAKEVLSKAKVIITLKEMEELKQKAKETQTRKEGTLAPILDIEDEGRKEELTEEAKKAEYLLSISNISITNDELRSLQKQSKELEYSEPLKLLDGKGIQKNSRALEALDLLKNGNFVIGLEEIKHASISAEEIGKATLSQQKESIKKQEEENSIKANLNKIKDFSIEVKNERT